MRKSGAVKTPAERGLIGAWAYESRTQADLSVPEVVDRLARRGVRVTEATLRGIEGGSKKPGRRLMRELAAIYGSTPPGESAPEAQYLDLGPLYDRLDRQATTIDALAASIAQLAAAISTGAGEVGTVSEMRQRLATIEEALPDLVAFARRGESAPAPRPSDAPTPRRPAPAASGR